MGINKNYSQQDFKKAIQNLLPPGEYWSNVEENSELDKVLNAISEELKITHEETKVSLLFNTNNTLQGWKLSDFQRILEIQNINGTVTDNPDTPNIINVQLSSTTDLLPVFRQMHNHKLAHTRLSWGLKASLRVNAMMQATTHQRLDFTEQ